MNVDTDAQYAFTARSPATCSRITTRPQVDGEVGSKKVYDPRTYMKKAEASMTERVVEACNDLHCAGKSVHLTSPHTRPGASRWRTGKIFHWSSRTAVEAARRAHLRVVGHEWVTLASACCPLTTTWSMFAITGIAWPLKPLIGSSTRARRSPHTRRGWCRTSCRAVRRDRPLHRGVEILDRAPYLSSCRLSRSYSASTTR